MAMASETLLDDRPSHVTRWSHLPRLRSSPTPSVYSFQSERM